MPYATNDGIEIYYQVVGEGPPIILAHGFGLDGEAWRDWGYVDGLQVDYKLILVDLRGHGRSGKLYDPNAYHTRLMAHDCISVLDDMGIEKAHFWGYSMGGGVALSMVQLAPERLFSLIIGGSHPYDRDEGELDAYNWILDILEGGLEAYMDFFGEQLNIMTPSMKERAQTSYDFEALKVCFLSDAGEGFEDTVQKIHLPCLVYVGEDDDAEYSGAKRFAEELSSSRFVSFPGFDHMKAGTESEAVLPHVKKFMEECVE